MLFFVLLVKAVVSQTRVDTVLTLEGVEISSAKIRENTTGQKVIPIDNVFLKNHESSNLAEILAKGSGIQIKSYNGGGLSSISFRGTAAQHTGIFWHGFNLNQMNTGTIDLSLIPGSGFDRVDVIPGGGASLFGSGNIGGGIHLIPEPVFDKGGTAGINAGIGSFNGYDAAVYNRMSTGKWYSKTMLNYMQAQNDFEFTGLRGQAGKMENNAFSRYGAMQDFYRMFQRSVWGVSLWYTSMDREIPPSVIEAPKDTEQYDRSFRGVISYRRQLKKPQDQAEIRSGYFDEYFRYEEKNTEGIPVMETLIKTQRSQTEASLRWVWKNQIVKTGLTGTGEFGESESWDGNVSRLRAGAYLLYTHEIPAVQWKVSVNLRQEFAEGYAIPFTPSVGAEGAICRWLSGKVNISRNYRIPTFNELFWVPGGNPGLRPEDSWNGETSLIVTPLFKSKSFNLQATGTLFGSWVKNWILWVPVSSWTEPRNIQTVWARGIESEWSAQWQKDKTAAGISGGYSFTRSTVQEKSLENDASDHKQLIYVPLHTFFIHMNLQYRGFLLSYNHRFNGMVFTTGDNLESLPGFQIGEFNLARSFFFGKSKLRLQAAVKNVWDEEYQVVENYPNPGRSFAISAGYEIRYH